MGGCRRKEVSEYRRKEGDIVPTLVMVYQERAAFSKGGIVYRFLHHDGAFIIFTPRVHTLKWWFSSLHSLHQSISLCGNVEKYLGSEILSGENDRGSLVFLSLEYVVGVLCRTAFDLWPFKNSGFIHMRRDIVVYKNKLRALIIFQFNCEYKFAKKITAIKNVEKKYILIVLLVLNYSVICYVI